MADPTDTTTTTRQFFQPPAAAVHMALRPTAALEFQPPPPAAAPLPPRREKAVLVEEATELACRSLLDGPWPMRTDFDVVAASLHQFSTDILLPSLEAFDPSPTAEHEGPIILGTLLALREVLILNSDRIFGIRSGDDDHDVDTTRPLVDTDTAGQHFVAATLATSVILSGLTDPSGPVPTSLAPTFLRMVDAYESGQGDFARLMLENYGVDNDDEDDDDDSQTSPTMLLPNGTPMSRSEQAAWSSSYRWNAQSHPSLVARRFGPAIRPVQPNAVHISVIGSRDETSADPW